MRWLAMIAGMILIPGTLTFAQTSMARVKQVQMPKPTAEPENGTGYAPPAAVPTQPSDADVGPVLRRFVRASTTDDLAESQNQDNASQVSHEKIALDKRITVPLIHDVENDGNYRGANNTALDYEVQYLNWGAVTREQLKARQGHYFTNTWVNDGPAADFTARFEYRQVKSKEIVRTLVQEMPHVSGATRSYFAVVDKAYLAYGPVCSWRFTILRGDTVVAEAKSFIW